MFVLCVQVCVTLCVHSRRAISNRDSSPHEIIAVKEHVKGAFIFFIKDVKGLPNGPRHG